VFISFREITCWVLERGTIVVIVAFMVVVAVESKTKEETEVGTDGGEEEGCGKGMASRAIRVESIREENFNVFKALISSWE